MAGPINTVLIFEPYNNPPGGAMWSFIVSNNTNMAPGRRVTVESTQLGPLPGTLTLIGNNYPFQIMWQIDPPPPGLVQFAVGAAITDIADVAPQAAVQNRPAIKRRRDLPPPHPARWLVTR